MRMCVCASLFIWKTDNVGFKDGMWQPVWGGLEALGHVRSGVWVVRICVCMCVFIWKTDTVGFKDGIWSLVGGGLVALAHVRSLWCVGCENICVCVCVCVSLYGRLTKSVLRIAFGRRWGVDW